MRKRAFGADDARANNGVIPGAEMQVQKRTIGQERAPLIVVENAFPDAEQLVELAATKVYGEVSSYYPGIRAKAPLSYQRYVIEQLGSVLMDTFALPGPALRFTACHFSLVTTPPAQLSHLQRIPHIDSLASNELALIHYLFKPDLGGTAFYRHRRTGFEIVNEQRKEEYFRRVEEEKIGPDAPACAYIDSDTPLYERVDAQAGVFNRLLVYRRNSLHSGCIDPKFQGDANPRTGRLSINGFLA